MSSTELVANGWFGERETLWPGQRMSLKVKRVLHEEHTGFQQLMVFDSETYGRVLVLDGVIQVTERDEFSYQEMIAHIPLFTHRNPRRVLVVGGGDGGVVREIAKHEGVEEIVMCEIDPGVVRAARRFFADTMAVALEDPRLTLVHEDAAEYIKRYQAHFDVIIVDSSDPVGPAETLFASDFFMGLRAALRPGGVVCTQGECMWLHMGIIETVLRQCSEQFPVATYAFTTIPTYPSGQIGFIICSTDPEARPHDGPRRPVSATMQQTMRYYTPAVHRAAFVLPAFADRVVAPLRKLAVADGTAGSRGAAAACAKAVAGCACPIPGCMRSPWLCAAAVFGVGAAAGIVLSRALR